MRPVAIISDVHANMEALDSVLGELLGMDVYCLGDFVDYGPEPNEVIETVRDRGVKGLLGNHDSGALTGDTKLFNARAAMSLKWTARQLTDKNRQYLRGLPSELKIPFGDAEAYFTHGSPDDRLWEYVDPNTHSNLFGHYLGKLGVQVIGLGHTHVPYVWREEPGTVFNPGSVGQPRDGDNRASYAILSFDGKEAKVELRRVPYDYHATASKIKAAGLPESFAERLASGT
ncbi:MAG TPA: metallophosphoesterase family protein [Nitrososphaerales archaeon]|nr:metallophosphoesterase family protein [Nitrososphaerales archaeon]